MTENKSGRNVNIHFVATMDELPPWADFDKLVLFLHENMKPWEDTPEDTARGVEYALSTTEDKGGFILLAERNDELIGALVTLRTGMGGYIPSNVLLFVAVLPSLRGFGTGGRLVREATERCRGDMKIHVEYENPAKRLYERCGYASKYAEMRFVRKET